MSSTMEGVIQNGDVPAAVATPDAKDEISAEEVALYDRQIRLWGMEAQARMRNAHILLVTIKALGNEISKNLVLAGIGAITVHDAGKLKGEDLGAQFFVEEEMIGQNRAEAAAPALQRLNPRVKVTTDIKEGIENRGTEFWRQFSVVIVTEGSLKTLTAINDKCREAGVAFYAGGCHGLYGYCFADLIKHQFVIEREKPNIDTKMGKETRTRSIVNAKVKKESDGRFKEIVTKEEVYCPISQVVTSQIDKTWRLRRIKAVSLVLPAVFALWNFQEKHNRLPDQNKEDTKLFMASMHDARNGLGLPLENVDPAFAISFLDSVGTELSPVAAILGGMLAQGVINYLGKREQPLQNFLVFDGDITAAPIYCLQPQDD